MPTTADSTWFSDDWARSWGRELGISESYRDAAAQWDGALLLTLEADPEHGIDQLHQVFLDLHHGECHEARKAQAEDLERAKYAIDAPPAVWRSILNGDMQPLPALAMGKLKLTKGSLASLLPFVAAARELVAAATRIETTFH